VGQIGHKRWKRERGKVVKMFEFRENRLREGRTFLIRCKCNYI